MTKKRYTYSELNNCQYSVDYTTFKEIYGEENIFHNRICEVNNKRQAQKVVDLLNEQEEEIQSLTEELKDFSDTNARLEERIRELEKELQNLQTFKKILEFAEKDMEERAYWQAYCEKEFEGL